MTLEQLAYLAEILGALLIIASLIYVAQQLRQNIDMMRANHANDFVLHTNSLILPITSDHDFAELWIRAESDFDELDATDQRRIILFEWQAIQAWHNWFNLRQRNLIADYQWNELIWGFNNFGKRRSAKEAWKIFRGSYTQQFRDFMAPYFE